MADNDNSNSGDAGSTNAGSTNDGSVDWKTQLGDLATNERLSGINSLQDLAKAFIDSPQKVTLPSKVEDYKLPDKVKIKGLRAMALENGFTQSQLDGLLKFHEAASIKAVNAAKEQRTTAEQTLKTEWGDKYDANIKVAKNVLKHFDGDKAVVTSMLKETGLSNDPRILKFLHGISASMKEGSFIGEDGNVQNRPKSLAERLFPNLPNSSS